MNKYQTKMMKYFTKNPKFNAYMHFIGGIGAGMLLTYPLAGEHPIRWGVVFLIIAGLGHWYAATHQ